jgi:hypothetical protein
MRVSSGGPAGVGDAFLSISANNRNLAAYNLATAWVGDYQAIGATEVNVDLMSPSESDLLAMRLVIMGPDSSVRWTSSTAFDIPTDGIWRNYTFAIAEDEMTKVLGIGSVTWDDTLQNVERIMLRHDPGTPSSTGTAVAGSLGIDNVQLLGAPLVLRADFSVDGRVDGLDLAIWEGEFGNTGSAADANGDGRADAADFLIWQREFGMGTPPASLASVPEPNTALLTTLLASALLVTANREPGPRSKNQTVSEGRSR